MRPANKAGIPKFAAREPQRETRTRLPLGPYESSYDVALGYGFERPIVMP